MNSAGSLDHLIRPVQERRLEPRCRSQRQLTRRRAIQEFCDLLSRDRMNLGLGRAVGHETDSVYEKTERMHRGQVGIDGEVGEGRELVGTE